MRRTCLLPSLACAMLAACLEPAGPAGTAGLSLEECARRATATGTALACDCGPCAAGDVCTKVGRCGKVVEGAAQPAKVMLALDRSGSMKTLPESDTQWGCSGDGTGNGYDPSGACKWNQLKALVAGPGGMLDPGAATARFGLALFPAPMDGGDACGVGRIDVPVPAAPGASDALIANALANTVPGGGTPSAATLRELASDFGFTAPDASRYVVLVTDGMPNCNVAASSCLACTNGGDPTKACGDVRNCLDSDALVGSVKTLKARQIDTFVVGFGASMASPEAAAVLDAAAEAGGRPLPGSRKHYQAGSADELRAILAAIGKHLQPCIYAISAKPADPDSLQVLMTDREASRSELLVRGTDWDYADASNDYVEVKGGRCEAIQASESCRYSLEFLALSAP